MRSLSDFSLAALYRALDAQRQARGLSWLQVTREINRLPDGAPVRAISVSTMTSLRAKGVAEADGVLQMLLWLKRTPESFVPGHPDRDDATTRLPDVPPHRILRFDTRKLHAALDAKRRARTLTWAQVAGEIGLGVSTLTHLAKGGRTGFPPVMRIVAGWIVRQRRSRAGSTDSGWRTLSSSVT
jgi:hypothetical protein